LSPASLLCFLFLPTTSSLIASHLRNHHRPPSPELLAASSSTSLTIRKLDEETEIVARKYSLFLVHCFLSFF
ncbi:hypothetical protein LINGRAHAP2_LOCUS23126, partial [Linum grandiflorum]